MEIFKSTLVYLQEQFLIEHPRVTVNVGHGVRL